MTWPFKKRGANLCISISVIQEPIKAHTLPMFLMFRKTGKWSLAYGCSFHTKTSSSLLECEQTWRKLSLHRNVKCDCDSAQPLVLLSHNKMGISWKEKIYGADPWPDVLLPPSLCPVASLEPLALWSRLMCDTKDSCPRYLCSHSVLCPHVSPHFIFEDLEQAPPSGSLPSLFHFPFPRPLYPPPNCLNSI